MSKDLITNPTFGIDALSICIRMAQCLARSQTFSQGVGNSMRHLMMGFSLVVVGCYIHHWGLVLLALGPDGHLIRHPGLFPLIQK